MSTYSIWYFSNNCHHQTFMIALIALIDIAFILQQKDSRLFHVTLSRDPSHWIGS